MDPENENVYLNMASLILSDEKSIVEEMNGLGNSSTDNKRYDELKAQKNDLFKSGAEILEKFLENNPNINEAGIYNQLANIYSALGEMDKFNAYKDKAKAIEAGN